MTRRVKESFVPPLWLLTVTAIVGAVWLAIQVKELMVLLVLGYFVAYAIDPILTRLERRGVSRSIGVFAVFGALLALLALLAVTAIPTVLAEFTRLSTNLSSYIEIGKAKVLPLLEEAQDLIPKGLWGEGKADVSAVINDIPSLASYISGDAVKSIGRGVLSALLGGYSITLTLVNVALLPFIVYYIAVDLPQIHAFFLALVPILRQRKVATVCGEIDRYVSSFVRGQIIVCTILFLLYAVGLRLVGVELWLLLAAISGFGNIIPYAGFIVGILLSSLMALVSFGDVSHVLWVWGVFAVVQFAEGTFITPKVLGESVGLSPLVIILALFAGGQLFGLLGVFLAVPAAAALRVLGRHSYEWVSNRT